MEHFYIGRELKKTSLLMKRAMGQTIRQVSKTELTAFQMDVIFFINHSEGDVFQKDLEKEFGLKRSTVSLGLNHMEEQGIIKRKSVKDDARLKRIVLTKYALEIIEKTGEIIEVFEQRLQSNFTKQELQVLMDSFEKLQNTLHSLDLEGKKHETK